MALTLNLSTAAKLITLNIAVRGCLACIPLHMQNAEIRFKRKSYIIIILVNVRLMRYLRDN
jgi:hypothetical protein